MTDVSNIVPIVRTSRGRVKTVAELEADAINTAFANYRRRARRALIAPNWADRVVFAAGWAASKKWSENR